VLAVEAADQSALGATRDHRGGIDALLTKEPPGIAGR
jgi:hypothetical protein